MIRAVCPESVADLRTGFVTGWNITPNVQYTISVYPGATSVAVWLFDAASGAYVAGGAALVGADQPVTLLSAASPGLGMVDADLGYHLLVTSSGTEPAQTFSMGPFVDSADHVSAMYTVDDIAVAQASAVIREGTHYTDDVSILCPLGMDVWLGDVVATTVHGEIMVGDIESISFQASPSSMADVVTVRRMSAILPDAPVVIVPPSVADDTADTDASTPTSGNVLTNDASGLTIAAVNGLGSNIGVSVAGSAGGVFTLAADGAWTFDPDGDFSALSGSDTAETSVTYHASNGLAEAMATLMVTVRSSDRFEFHDPFDALDGARWDVSGLASAVISGGALVTEGVANTWGVLFGSAARYLGEIRENMDVSVDLAWTGRSADLCEQYLCLRDSTGAVAYVGMADGMSSYPSGTLMAGVGASSWGGTAYGAGASGSASLRAEVRGHNISLYIDGSLKIFGALPGFVTDIALTNTRHQGYNGKRASWDNFSLVEV